MQIVFVCSGNTCRSPLALAAWRALQSKGEAPETVEAISAGLLAEIGHGASSHSIAIASQWGDDLSTHVAQQLGDEVLTEADNFFVMTEDQAFALREYFEVPSQKVHLLGAFDEARHPEILDPFGGSHEAYETCAAQIYRAVQALAVAIERGELREQN